MIKKSILKLSKKENLSYDEAEYSMKQIMSGNASSVQISSYLTALTLKGETIDEITASAYVMREHSKKLLNDMDILEIVGTGGDFSNSFNISTASAIIISSAGVSVAKHGNRAASSKCGCADVLEALGVNINLTPEESKKLLDDINICFLFAQNYHSAMKYVAPVRKELGIKTIFNILGPLSNPAGANMELMGVYDESLVEPLAEVMRNLGVKRGMVVYGMDKLDEISVSSKTKVCEISENGKLSTYYISPEDFGYSFYDKNEIEGGDAYYNANIIKDILASKLKGAKRNIVCLNAGASLYIAGKAESIYDGIKMAEEIIDSGKAMEKLNMFIEKSNDKLA
ncbi:anthranilate phosphoribosyltransferase [Brachyspira murdochii]|uniref:anthranilate phosphoribosyltransferase n=1 Tax=Brachyspira murdochii TaxID=84378 RepID=UPI00300548C0